MLFGVFGTGIADMISGFHCCIVSVQSNSQLSCKICNIMERMVRGKCLMNMMKWTLDYCLQRSEHIETPGAMSLKGELNSWKIKSRMYLLGSATVLQAVALLYPAQMPQTCSYLPLPMRKMTSCQIYSHSQSQSGVVAHSVHVQYPSSYRCPK